MSAPQNDKEVEGMFLVGVDAETGDIGFAFQREGEELDEDELLVVKDVKVIDAFIQELQDAAQRSLKIRERIAARRHLS